MMHTFKSQFGNVTFIFNADYQGDLEISDPDSKIVIPCEAVVDFVSQYVKDKMIEKIEDIDLFSK